MKQIIKEDEEDEEESVDWSETESDLEDTIEMELGDLREQMTKISETLKLLEDITPILSSSKPEMGQFKQRNKVELTTEQQAQREKMLADRAERKKKKANH